MRPSDWSPLGLSSDPTPGDPTVVRTAGQNYTHIANAIASAAATLRKLDAGASNADSVKALLETRDDVTNNVSKAEGRYRTTGEALTTYATTLDRVQGETLQALTRARSAASDLADATSLATYYGNQADDASAPDQAEDKAGYQQKQQQQQQHATTARNTIATEQGNVQQSVADRDSAAQTAIDKIHNITESDGLNDSWWDNWGAKLTEWIATIAEAIATIAGILALLVCWIPVIGQALAGILLIVAAVAGIVAALANIVLAATGEKSWSEALLSVVFAALGCIGLGSLRGAFGALKFAAKGWKLAGGLKGLGGVAGLLKASGQNFLMTMKNLGKMGKLLTQGRTAPRFGEQKITKALYTTLRKQSPTTEIRNMVNNGVKTGGPDLALPGLTVTKGLQADHIVSMANITKMEGFDLLTEAQQLTILNYADNFVGLSASANASKGARPFAEWTMYLGGKNGTPHIVNPLFTSQMVPLENLLGGRLQFLIDTMVAAR